LGRPEGHELVGLLQVLFVAHKAFCQVQFFFMDETGKLNYMVAIEL